MSEEEERPPAPPVRLASAVHTATPATQKPLPSVPPDDKKKKNKFFKLKNEDRRTFYLIYYLLKCHLIFSWM